MTIKKQEKMTLGIVGMGLIGGSLAIDLRRCGFADKIIGVDKNQEHAEQALELGLADEMMPLDDALWHSDLLVLAIPVDYIVAQLPEIMDKVSKNIVVTDVGSTKSNIIQAIANHPKRGRFVASHPMAGTEYSGPKAALKNLFQENVAIICNKEESDDDAVALVEKMYRSMYMELLYMDAQEHDVHAAYVSHISHISSFVLAATVLDKEQSTETIFNLASGGFRSTVRLAKSSPAMWTPIFLQNRENMLKVLETYIEKMQEFKQLIADSDVEALHSFMEEARKIRKVIS